jgi:hypothetical protein
MAKTSERRKNMKWYVGIMDGNEDNVYEWHKNDIEALNGLRDALEVWECANDECLTPVRLVDKFDTVTSVLSSVCSLLPHTNDYRIWSDGEEILCETEQLAESIADLLDAMYGDQTVNTGYYDPEEDERNNEVTNSTGFYYVTVN